MKASNILYLNYIERYSPHHNARPLPVHGVMVHACGEYIAGIWAPEFMEKYRLSYHALVEPSGRVIVTVPRRRRAWHAGLSRYQGENNLNNSYIGFCLMLAGDWSGQKFIDAMNQPDVYTPKQLEALVLITVQAMKNYPLINPNRLVTHSRASGPEVRPDPKHDPGHGFSLDRFKSDVMEAYHGY
jgi:N-acetyl-anhydromuramyl-L-alanine amidase AmpD